jgi:hypothetical protein
MKKMPMENLEEDDSEASRRSKRQKEKIYLILTHTLPD